jgi:hypothetical protein
MYTSLAVTKEQMKKLWLALFGDCVYKLRMCCAFVADMKSGLRGLANYRFPSESDTYLPNPHIQFYGCTGTYSARFAEYMKKHDYVGAIDQAVVSGRNINFYDSAVISLFVKNLSASNTKCIEKADGTLLTPKEAINELEGEG